MDPGFRFENYVAVQLKGRLQLWEDATGVKYSLFYIRNKEKQETDFLILRDKKPWLLVESKLSDQAVSSHHKKHREMLGNIPLVQICQTENIATMESKGVFRMSASRFLAPAPDLSPPAQNPS